MTKWLAVKVADDIPSEKMQQLLNDVTDHQCSTWYENTPRVFKTYVFKTSQALDEITNAWLKEEVHTRDRYQALPSIRR